MSHKILRIHDVSKCTGLSRATINRYVSAGEFPKPISIGVRAIGFVEAEIQEWIEVRINESRQDANK